MKWIWIITACLVITRVASGPTRDDDIQTVDINKIDRTESPDKYTITLSKEPSAEVTKVILAVHKTGTTEKPVESKDSSVTIAPSFNIDLNNFFGLPSTFIITGHNDKMEDLTLAEAALAPFPNFPNNPSSKIFQDEMTPTTLILRVDGSLESMTIGGTTSLIIGDVNYYSFESQPQNYQPCCTATGTPNDVTVCDVELNPGDPEENHDPIMSSVILSYRSDGTAVLKFTSFENTLDIQEVVLMAESLTAGKNIFCNKDKIKQNKCTVDWTNPTSDTLPMIIVQKTSTDGTEAWKSNHIQINDREMVATRLGTDIIEGRWKMFDKDGLKAEKEPLYRLTITDSDGSISEVIEVDCSHLTTSTCFGYFPNADPTKTYSLRVAYKAVSQEQDAAITYNELDQIESAQVPPPTPSTLQSELEILSRQTTMHQNLQEMNVKICFQHLTATEGGPFSHYEMLIINKKGQWLKHKIMEESNEESLCFESFSINTKNFDLTGDTKVVISQRGVDGVTVLATGETLLL